MLLPSFTMPLLPRVGEAASCTRGVDCYCDRVKNAAAPIYDASLLICEDFEAPTLHDDTGFGGGPPNYGPWYDNTGQLAFRGNNSYWVRTYGDAIGNCKWQPGAPATPTVGFTCTVGSGTCGAGAWRADDRWQANSFSCIDIVRNGEFGAEDANVLAPINGGVPGVFDGNQSFAHRIGAGAPHTSGVLGEKHFTTQFSSIGITMGLALPTNIVSTGVFNEPWKGNYLTVPDGSQMWPFGTHTGGTISGGAPFGHGLIYYITERESGCNAKLAAANVRKGNVFCDSSELMYYPDPAVYSMSRDWPLGTWGCVQGHFQNLNSTNFSVKIWMNNLLVVDFDGFDDRGLKTKDGIGTYAFNGYSNANQGSGHIATTSVAYRYEDNIHVRAGAPVSCAQIGFLGTSGGAPPSAPSGLQVR
jgi:hypothetical protein